MLIKAIVPEYYDKFSCTGGNCRYTCCQEWKIYITKSAYQNLRNLRKSSKFEQAVRDGLKRNKVDSTTQNYAAISLDPHTKLCTFLDEDGLCMVHKECGYSKLPEICQAYPRNISITPDHFEYSCSAGCEAVIKLLTEIPNGIVFNEIEEESNERISGIDIRPMYAYLPIMKWRQDILSQSIRILQNRHYSLEQRILLLGIALRDLATLIDANQLHDMVGWMERTVPMASGGDLRDSLTLLIPQPKFAVLNNIATGNSTRGDNPHFEKLYDSLCHRLGLSVDGGVINFELDRYELAKTNLASHPTLGGIIDPLFENLLVNLTFSIFCPYSGTAVWDFYMFLCSYYSFMRFITVGTMDFDSTIDDLIHALAIANRPIVHNLELRKLMVAELRNNSSDTLAHMAVLISG